MVQSTDLQMAEVLTSLGDPLRLALLRRLSQPHSLAEIHAQAVRHEGLPAGDQMSPEHFHAEYLEPLIDLGVVTFREREGGDPEYVLNQPTLYALAEKVNDVGRLTTPSPRNLNIRAPPLPKNYRVTGPCLVLVKGLWEGRTFELPKRPEGSWVIGRSSQAEVCLDYDPYVGPRNTAITWVDGAYRVEDLQGGRGTKLNFQEMGRGASQALRSGDVVGVGRSLLMARF